MAKSIYTQAMADNNELPSVGMACMFKHGGNEESGVVTAITKEFIVLTNKEGKERIRKLAESHIRPLAECEPLAPPIILIDGEAYQFDTEGQSLKGIYREYNHRFYNAMGDYLVSTSTNIKHLT